MTKHQVIGVMFSSHKNSLCQESYNFLDWNCFNERLRGVVDLVYITQIVPERTNLDFSEALSLFDDATYLLRVHHLQLKNKFLVEKEFLWVKMHDGSLRTSVAIY